MNPGLSIAMAGILAFGASVAFSWFVRLPLPFDGFAAVAAAGLAGVGTLTLVAFMPATWLWTEADRLRHAFQARHGISEYASGSALEAITMTHQRAALLRNAATAMREDVAQTVNGVADRLDAAAREIFYEPERHRSLRAVLIRAELIEDAALAHAALRKRNQTDTEDVSRKKMIAALDALNAAFEQSDLQAARGLLQDVEAASEVAETLLTPHHALQTRSDLSS